MPTFDLAYLPSLKSAGSIRLATGIVGQALRYAGR